MLRPALRLPLKPFLHTSTSTRAFTLFPTSTPASKNRIYDPIRQPADLHTLTLLCAANNLPLVTLWSATWCPTCQTVKPLLRRLIEDEKVGESEGGLGFTEVLMDSTLIGDLPVTYRVSSMPTLLAFSRQEVQFEGRVVRPEDMRDEAFLRRWLEGVARKGGRKGGGGGGLFG
ncbi:thioredoxin protein [Pyrenophora teres f. maculata]|nr:thioredoxin protein [Pyrenophora teres f. maculata]